MQLSMGSVPHRCLCHHFYRSAVLEVNPAGHCCFFVLLLSCAAFGWVRLGWQASFLLGLTGSAELGSLPLLDGSLPAASLPALVVQHCDQFVFSPLSLSTLRPVVVYQENRRGTGGGAKGPSPTGVDADSPSAGERGKMAHFEWGAWPSLLKPRPQP